jgi:(p)ppGpp synthase/HD superfamily hydrolase
MITDQEVVRIMLLAKHFHKGQFRRDGVTPYIEHPLAVGSLLRELGASNNVRAIGYLHDVLEDCKGISAERLFHEGIDPEIVVLVTILTREQNEDYDNYLSRIKKIGGAAVVVKIADIVCNLSDKPTEKQKLKYLKALLFLQSKD